MGTNDIHHKKRKSRLTRKSKKNREYKNSILIICEGEKTEPNYFNSFQVSNVEVKTIGLGMNTTSLVEEAIIKWKELEAENRCYEHLWCVFDRDEFLQEKYNQAFETIISEEKKLNKRFKRSVGREIKIFIAYSNQAFELWYLLHYDFIESACHRSQYQRMLSDRMGKEYKKNDAKMYQTLQELSQSTNDRKGQNFAIRNAKNLRSSRVSSGEHNQNPSTSVDKLVVELNGYLKK